MVGDFMGNYSVPKEIRELKPTGTCVKNIKGHFYVYEQKNVKGEDGKWKRKSGACIGKIEAGIGFVSNKVSFYDEEITTLEYGQYAVTLANTSGILEKLLIYFGKEDAYRIYIISIIHFVNTFQHRKSIESFVRQSYISILFPSLKFGDESISGLLDNLGRRQRRVIEFEQSLISASSGNIAIDGHVVPCCSHENDIAAFGNKYRQLKDMQLNILMAYDAENNTPLFSKVYDGGTLDKSSVKDLFGTVEFKGVLFIVDRGFYSAENISLFSSDGNKYIIPLGENLNLYKKATEKLEFAESFVYETDKKRTCIQYYEKNIGGRRIIVFRDSLQNAIDSESYRKNIGSRKGCTQENYECLKDFFGLIVLQTNLEKAAADVYTGYKKRWNIETFYDHLKNTLNFNAFYEQDYYKLEGMSFIMLITSMIYEEMSKATAGIKNKTLYDCLNDARMIKIHYEKNNWVRTNMKTKIQELFSKLNTNYTDTVLLDAKLSST